jgi:hypothetical protein
MCLRTRRLVRSNRRTRRIRMRDRRTRRSRRQVRNNRHSHSRARSSILPGNNCRGTGHPARRNGSSAARSTRRNRSTTSRPGPGRYSGSSRRNHTPARSRSLSHNRNPHRRRIHNPHRTRSRRCSRIRSPAHMRSRPHSRNCMPARRRMDRTRGSSQSQTTPRSRPPKKAPDFALLDSLGAGSARGAQKGSIRAARRQESPPMLPDAAPERR